LPRLGITLCMAKNAKVNPLPRFINSARHNRCARATARAKNANLSEI
jgi:hypothetical protein